MTLQIHARNEETRPPPDAALTILQADHRMIRHLFQHYEATHAHALQRRIAADVFTALARHTAREDTILYAVFAVATDAACELLIGDAFRAHQLCTLLLEELGDLAPDDARFVRGWHALRDQIEQHMAEEERELFPQAARLLATEMAEITAAIQENHALPSSRRHWRRDSHHPAVRGRTRG